jgi:curved DNA-binding protein CbpA
MNYFKDCKTQDDVKRLYRELAKKLHPDQGGTDELMRELTRQYESWIPANKFSQSSTMSEEEYRKYADESQKWWNENLGKQSQYAGYGGYRYANIYDMKKEYFKQAHDPRLADYERMKNNYNTVLNNQEHLRKSNFDLQIENEKLKKKITHLEKKLKQPPKAKKDGKKSQSICL